MRSIRIWTVIMMILNSLLLIVGSMVTYEVFDHRFREISVLFLTVPAFLSIPSNIYLGFSLAISPPKQSEYLAIPLPNPEQDSLSRTVQGMGIVNMIYAVSLAVFGGFFLWNLGKIGSDGLVFFLPLTFCLFAYAGLNIWHVLKVFAATKRK